MAKDTDLAPVDGETLEQLEQVRKGKPRKFVMICKGASLVSLVVYKKGSLDKFKKQAKEGGKGQLYHGVVDGRGADLRFALSRAEGFDKEPVKSLVLKSYLEESADFKCKPRFEIVDALGPVLDEDDPLVKRFLALQASALSACETHPEKADELGRQCLAVGQDLDQDLRDEATAKLDTLESTLAALGAPPSTSTSTTSDASTSTTSDVGSQQELEALVKRIRAELDLMVNGGIDATVFVNALASIDELRQASQFGAALDAVKLLASQLGDDCRLRLAEVESRLQKLLAGSFTDRAGDVEKIKTVFGFAQERADTERFGSALVALQNVEKLLDAAEAQGAPKESDVIRAGTVAERRKFAESRWQATVREIRLQLDKIRSAIETHQPDEEADELATEIEAAVDDFCDDLNRAILGIGKVGDEDSKPIESALKTIGDYRKRLATDPLILHLGDVGSELGADADIAATLTGAFDELETQLAS